MAIADNLKTVIDDIARSRWEITSGRVVPETEAISLGNRGVRLEATILYADLADSTDLASYSQTKAAEVYKAFLICGTKLILHKGGSIRSFDGDRVMGVFVGDSKNTNAAKTALHLKWVFDELLVPRFKEQYQEFRNGTLTLNYCAGIDTGSVLVARAGVRSNNDLIWVGEAANVAAKLSTLRKVPYRTYITADVYNRLSKEAKVSHSTGEEMWEARSWSDLPMRKQAIYRSSWWRKP